MRIIINGDDLGIQPLVNEAIFDAMAAQQISSATAIANAPHIADAARAMPRFPASSFGAHLNLTEFRPLSPTPGLTALLDGDGAFHGRVRAVPMTLRLLQAIYVEWRAQIERLLAFGVPVTHLDSHHHVHTLPALFPVLKLLQRRYGIRRVRTTRNIDAQDTPAWAARRLKKRVYHELLRRCYRTRTTAGFTDLLTFYAKGRTTCLTYPTVEIMVHPGAAGGEQETRLLQSPWRQDLRFATQLISYRELS